MSNCRKVLAGGALLLLFIGVAIAYGRPEAVRRAVLARVKAATGREVTVGGGIELRIGFAPNDVRVANAPWGKAPYLLAAEQLEVQWRCCRCCDGLRAVRLNLVEPSSRSRRTATATGSWARRRARRSGLAIGALFDHSWLAADLS